MPGADVRHSDPAHCHSEADSASFGYYITSWALHSYPTRAITGPSFCTSNYASWGADYRRGRGSWAIISTSFSSHHLIIFIVSFIYVLYVFPLYFLYWSSSRNPMVLILYTGINCITCSLFVFSSNEVIQIYQFLSTLSINLFLIPLLISCIVFETCGFSNQYSKLISLRRYHFLPLITVTHITLRTMLTSVGGEKWGRKYAMLKEVC